MDDPNRDQVSQSRSKAERRTLAAFGALSYRPIEHIGMRAELRTTWERLELDSSSPISRRASARRSCQHFTDITPRLSVDFAPRECLPVRLRRERLTVGRHQRDSRPAGQRATVRPRVQLDLRARQPVSRPARALAGPHDALLHRLAQHAALGIATTPGITNLITRNTAGVNTPGCRADRRCPPHANLSPSRVLLVRRPGVRTDSDDPGSSAFCGLRGGNKTSSFCTVGPPRNGAAIPGTYVPYIDGNTLQRAPQTQWHVGLRGDYPLFETGWRVSPAVDLSDQDDVYDRAINGARYGERTLLSARLGLGRGAWTIELWGTNLTDELYIRSVSSRGARVLSGLAAPPGSRLRRRTPDRRHGPLRAVDLVADAARRCSGARAAAASNSNASSPGPNDPEPPPDFTAGGGCGAGGGEDVGVCSSLAAI